MVNGWLMIIASHVEERRSWFNELSAHQTDSTIPIIDCIPFFSCERLCFSKYHPIRGDEKLRLQPRWRHPYLPLLGFMVLARH